MISDTHIKLPSWLDTLIFSQLKAKYCRSNQNMLVIDWDKDSVRNYLGTYFPRSYAESYCIFSNVLSQYKNLYNSQDVISIFDFGCGTGGEIVGLITAIKEQLPNIKLVKVAAFDGNIHALHLFESIALKVEAELDIKIEVRVMPLVIDDFYDMSMLLDLINDEEFDFFITFKAICEFVSKQEFEKHNPYQYIVSSFLPKLKTSGIMCIVDITSYSSVSQEWLPRMMDQGINQAGANSILQNQGYNESFYVTHSHQNNDLSKIAWRIIKK